MHIVSENVKIQYGMFTFITVTTKTYDIQIQNTHISIRFITPA